MTFTEQVKLEILNKNHKDSCCEMASLSAFVRGAGSITKIGGNIGFEITTESKQTANYYYQILKKLFGAVVENFSVKDKLSSREKYILTCSNSKSFSILQELGILTIDNGEIAINLNIDKYLIENECCKISYIEGAFIGSGSITIPKLENDTSTSYHLEIVFSKYNTATDFVEILSKFNFLPKLISRKQNYVVYLKNAQEICDFLALVGANKSYLYLTELIVEKDVRNSTNRKVNCEMGNLTKQIDASIKQIRNINLIKEILGLDNLPVALKEVAIVRLENPESTLPEMAKTLKITKSCLNHRLRKINEIANNLK